MTKQKSAVLSETAEDYLKQIFLIEMRGDGPASTTELSHRLNVSTAAVTNMLKRLSEKGLVNHSYYKGVTLSEPGHQVALRILRNHRLAEVFLTQVLDYSWDEVHEEAELLEHHISSRLQGRIWDFAGRPKRCPHGAPIPDEELRMSEKTCAPLTHAELGETVVIRQVAGSGADMLRFLETQGLVPGARLEVIEKAPFNGPVKAMLGNEERIIWREIADNIFVEQAINE